MGGHANYCGECGEGEWEMGYYDSLYGYGTVIFLMKGLCLVNKLSLILSRSTLIK